MLDVAAASGDSRAVMGEALAAGARIDVTATIAGVAAGKAVLIANGAAVQALPGAPLVAFRLDRKAACGWIAVNVTTEDGKLLLVGNPIYVRCGRG